ncbi:MAG: twin-arginine translocation signal domain-containing protein [Actinomycetota bacterium]|nr:twin-arginine translocation signal domain-containing protein [Actinomycetota bacterium]
MVDDTEEGVRNPGDDPGDAGDGKKAKSRLSRRSFVGRGSVGVAAAGVMASVPGLPSWLASSAPEASGAAGDANVAASDSSVAEQSIVAQVHNLSTGDISLHINGTTVAVRDPQLARNIARALP